jgi:hypothetical protein
VQDKFFFAGKRIWKVLVYLLKGKSGISEGRSGKVVRKIEDF